MTFNNKKNGVGVILVIFLFAVLLGISLTGSTPHKSIEPEVEKVIVEKPSIKYDTIVINRATRYHAEVSQCDDSPFKTADGSRIVNSLVKSGKQRWVALSRDLINDVYRNLNHPRLGHWQGKIQFGDTIIVHSEKHPFLNGEWVVHDCMNARYKKSMDFLTVRGQKPVLGVGRGVKIIIKHKS